MCTMYALLFYKIVMEMYFDALMNYPETMHIFNSCKQLVGKIGGNLAVELTIRKSAMKSVKVKNNFVGVTGKIFFIQNYILTMEVI